MRIQLLALCAAAAPLLVSAGTINMGTSSDTVSFNGSYDTLTLGSDDCSTNCVMSGTGSGTGVGTFNWSFTMPNDATSPFSYFGEPSAITTTGSPTLTFWLSDTHSDSASGTFELSSLASDGGSGVDIYGSVTIDSVTAGSNSAAFDSYFGVPSSTPMNFTLDVGNCTSGRKSEPCIAPIPDPTAQYLSLQMSQGTPIPAGVPEPGTFALLGAGSTVAFFARRFSLRKRAA